MLAVRILGATAAVGGLIWAGLVACWQLGATPFGWLEIMFLLAPLVAIPLAHALELRARDRREPALIETTLALASGPAAWLVAASFFLRTGNVAAALVLPWAAIAATTALLGLVRLAGRARRGAVDQVGLAVDVSAAFLTLGAFWLVISRLGRTFLGFGEPLAILTAVHFHFAGRAAPILIGYTAYIRAEDRGGRRLRGAAIGVIVGMPLVAVGITMSPIVALAGTVVLSVALIALAAVQVELRPVMRSPISRTLLLLSSGSIAIGMALALVYALGVVVGNLWLDVPAMARTHGVINGIGFILGALFAWTFDRRHP